MLDELRETDGALTLCDTFPDVLALKLLSPAYRAATVREPELVNAIEHEPAREERALVQLSLVLAVTVTDPVGPTPVPVALKLNVTGCCRVDGLGELPVIEIVLVALVAVVFCVLGAGAE